MKLWLKHHKQRRYQIIRNVMGFYRQRISSLGALKVNQMRDDSLTLKNFPAMEPDVDIIMRLICAKQMSFSQIHDTGCTVNFLVNKDN